MASAFFPPDIPGNRCGYIEHLQFCFASKASPLLNYSNQQISSILEQHRSHYKQAAAPGLKLMACIW